MKNLDAQKAARNAILQRMADSIRANDGAGDPVVTVG